MKPLLLIVLFVANLCCAQSIDSLIKKEGLQKTVAFLSSDSLRGRLTGSDGANKAASFIRNAFTKNIPPVDFVPNYYDSFFVSVKGENVLGINIAGCIPSPIKNDSFVIISAHYDHLGSDEDLPANKESKIADGTFNGANDNACGVAAMLEIAKYYAALKLNKYNILFVAFSGEELGLTGSAHLADVINTRYVTAVINMDMIGRPEWGEKCMVIAANPGKIAKKLNQQLYGVKSKERFFKQGNYSGQNLFLRSDHYPFTNHVKNAFTLFTTSPTDRYYHSVDDEFSTIDFDFLTSTTKKIAKAIRCFIE